MRYENRLLVNVDHKRQRELASLGFDVQRGLSVFVVDGSDPRWPGLRDFVAREELGFTETPIFDPAEVASAKYCWFAGGHAHGLLVDDSAWEEGCSACGCGQRQVRPYRMKQEPRWGKKFDLIRFQGGSEDIFCKPETWERVFSPLGVGCMEVLNARGSSTLKTVVQLVPEETVALKTTGIPVAICKRCGSDYWDGYQQFRGRLPPPASEPQAHLFLTRQWFRVGAYIFRAIIGSSELIAAMRDHKLRGPWLWPLADGESG